MFLDFIGKAFINFQARKLSLIEARDELLFFSKNYNIFQ